MNINPLYIDWNEHKEDIRDLHKGETGIVIANGPSLNNVPRDFLDKHPTIGTNNIYLYGMTEEEIEAYPETPLKFVPNFYTILGMSQLDTADKRDYCHPIIKAVDLAFVNRLVYAEFNMPHVYAIHGVRVSTKRRPQPKQKFSYDIKDFVGIGYTNTYIMLQVMYHLGFTKILCVGLDNDYGKSNDRLHFYPDDERFACEPVMGRRAHEMGSKYVFGLAKKAYEMDGREIININKVNNTPFEQGLPEDYY